LKKKSDLILKFPFLNVQETQTLPVMNSTSICKQQIKEGIVQSTKCEETHLFRPLSSEKGGARTDVSSSITLVSTASGSVQVSSSKLKLIY